MGGCGGGGGERGTVRGDAEVAGAPVGPGPQPAGGAGRWAGPWGLPCAWGPGQRLPGLRGGPPRFPGRNPGAARVPPCPAAAS